MLNPNALSIVTNVFTEPRERAMAIGVWGGIFGISAASGPVLGGILVDSVGWRAIFWVNIPIGAAAFVLTSRLVPESRAERPRRIDPPGQVLAIAALASLTYAIIEGPGRGWESVPILSLFIVAGAALVAFIAVERRRSEPLLDPGSSGARRWPGRPGSPSWRSSCWPGSCSSTRSTCKGCAATRPRWPGSRRCRPPPWWR